MSDIVIKAENLGKKYTIGHQAENGRYVALRDVLMQNARNFWYKTKDLARGKPIIIGDETEEVWALKDVSFEVQRGEVVGIIGRNGAGKSTLLKVLSRITEPSTGRVTIKGRVASLLEVGTGFHPELTGRENIYLNGAILGMTRAEIKRKFDEIVAFAEVERYLDTPVKRYSSGMYVRLAFAVAAQLEPEILLVDEVLAVGDAAFQKKCLGKMGDVAREGRTVLFVSHSMTAVKALCSSAILLKNGHASQKQAVDSAIMEYFISIANKDESPTFPIRKDEVILHNFVVTQDGYTVAEYDSGKSIDISISYELTRDLSLFRIGFFLTTLTGDLISRSLLADWKPEHETMAQGKYEIRCQIPPNLIAAGNYVLEVHCSRYGIKDYGFNRLTQQQITITSPSDFNLAHIGERTFGFILLAPKWSLKKITSI